MSDQTMADELQERMIDFAVFIIQLSSQLPHTEAGKHVARQILRSGTSPAPNYGEARGAESRADFVHKLGIVLKELNETLIWLKIIKRSELASPAQILDLLNENLQLSKIITASVKTAKAGSAERNQWKMENGKRKMENSV